MLHKPRRTRSDWYKRVRDAGRETAAVPSTAAPPSPWLGHNQGPPIEGRRSWSDHCWRRSRRRAWRTAPLEVVRRRVGRARKLGLSYYPYVLVILERGVNLQAVIFGFAGTLVRGREGRVEADRYGRVRPLRGVVDKLARLRECLVCVVADDSDSRRGRARVDQIDAEAGRVVDDVRVSGVVGEETTDGMIEPFLRQFGLAPAAAFLVGSWESERRRAGNAGLGLFLWAADYFSDTTRP